MSDKPRETMVMATPPLATALPESLMERVERLETAVASMQDTRQLEERLVAVVSQRVQRALPEPEPMLLQGGRRLLPMAAELLRARPALGSETPAGEGSVSRPVSRAWLLVELLGEIRGMYRMVTDPRYRMTWPARAAIWGLVPVILLSWWLWYIVPLFGLLPTIILSPLDKVLDIVLILVAYKILSRELQRYRDLVPDYHQVYGR